MFKVKITANFKVLMNVCPDDIFWITEPFTTKLGMVMHSYEPDCLQKWFVCCIQGQGHSERSFNEIWLSHMSLELLIPLQLNLVWWHIIIRWIVLWKDCITLFLLRSRSQKKFRTPVNVYLEDISSASEPSITKLGMVMHHHGPKCHARRLVCCL